MFSYRPGVLDLTPRLKADIAKEMKPSKRPPRRARQQEKPRASASLSAHNALIAQLTGFAFGMPRAPGASFPGGPPPSTLHQLPDQHHIEYSYTQERSHCQPPGGVGVFAPGHLDRLAAPFRKERVCQCAGHLHLAARNGRTAA